MNNIKVNKYTGLYLNAAAIAQWPKDFTCPNIAQIRIEKNGNTLVIRGDPHQTLDEFIISLCERAGERIEVEENGKS